MHPNMVFTYFLSLYRILDSNVRANLSKTTLEALPVEITKNLRLTILITTCQAVPRTNGRHFILQL